MTAMCGWFPLTVADTALLFPSPPPSKISILSLSSSSVAVFICWVSKAFIYFYAVWTETATMNSWSRPQEPQQSTGIERKNMHIEENHMLLSGLAIRKVIKTLGRNSSNLYSILPATALLYDH